MKTQLRTRASNRVIPTLILVSLSVMFLWHTRAMAESAAYYQPKRLLTAERALERGQSDRALNLLADYVEHQRYASKRAEGYALICRAHFKLKAFVAAEQACDQALRDGRASMAWSHLNNRGVMRLLQGNYAAALSDFDAAAEKNPSSRAVRKNRALAEREIALVASSRSIR